MLGYTPASGRAVRDWLEKFHDAQAVVRDAVKGAKAKPSLSDLWRMFS